MDFRTQIATCCVALLLCGVTAAQKHSAALSEAEEEQVRDAAIEPARRVAVYQSIIEARVRRIQDALSNTRAQGRREDIRENMDDITGLLDELQDNLEDYERGHRDLRKPLPKLLDAMVRWESVLKQPPDNDTYNLTRKLALEAVADVKKEAAEMLPSEIAYFKEHPPNKDADPNRVGPVEGAERANPPR